MIRGTSLRLNDRVIPAVHDRSSSNNSRVQSPTVELRRNGSVRPSRLLTTRMQTIKVSLAKPMTLSELLASLGTWRDPEEGAQDFTAKERIQDCFEQKSDSLDLSFLCLTTLPDAVGRLQHVQFLSIANNYFSEIPSCLASLTALRLLNISNNILKEVPDSIRQFAKLEFLNVASNQLCKVSAELGRLSKIETVILSHNRILEFPESIHRIKELEKDDQVPLASFAHFSTEFADRWEDTVQYEISSGNWEIWVARYQQILSQPNVIPCAAMFRERIGMLLDAMAKSSSLRQQCFEEATNVIGTCYDGILFSLFVMEIRHIEEQIITLQLSDDEVRKQMERVFNFHRLQERTILYSRENLNALAATDDDIEIEALEANVFFYFSPANTLDMPLEEKRLRYACNKVWITASDDDVRRTVWQIADEKEGLGPDFLIDYVLDREFWMTYLEVRYAEIIDEHTQIFMDQLDQLDARKHQIREYDYLTQSNALVEEKTESERRLYRQLTKNIVAD